MSGRPLSALRCERGQSLVELAVALPFLVSLLLGIIQVGIVVNNYSTLVDAARVAARQAITIRVGGSTEAEAIATAQDVAGNLNQSELQVNVDDSDWTTPGTEITVTTSYPYSINLPLIGAITSGTLTATAKERLE